ncbi:hypothetical protein [Sporosarcina sp. UB5]|uniref:hypothetical protein n=1 Tax=Sporosarcina sp. UB5 TaxID=3047463 RepID=UPI003D795930
MSRKMFYERGSGDYERETLSFERGGSGYKRETLSFERRGGGYKRETLSFERGGGGYERGVMNYLQTKTARMIILSCVPFYILLSWISLQVD